MTFTLRRPLPLLFALAASAAHGQWTVTLLHPAYSPPVGMTDQSWTNGAGRGDQVGRIWERYAAMWSRTSASLVNLNPPFSESSECFSTDGVQQAGRFQPPGVSGGDFHAIVWNGSASSYTDLNPPGSSNSAVFGIRGGQQVGRAYEHAALWTGSAGTYVNLHPPIFSNDNSSYARATDGFQQVGYVAATIGDRACLWTGTQASYVILHPAGAVSSYAYGVDSGQQCGSANVTGSGERPGIWTGTAGSWISLLPAGAAWGEAFAVKSGVQVGQVVFPNKGETASLWTGTPGSFVDLGAYLPIGYASSSRATGVWIEGGTTYVCGSAIHNGARVAVLWRSPAVPTAMSGIIGLNDVVWNPGYPRSITVQVKQGAVTLATRTINVGTTAALSMNVPGAGSAVVTIDGPTQLIRRRNVFLDGNPIDLGSVVLNNGDCDGSGEVDAVDIDFVIAKFGQTFSLGDVDLSGEVDAVDIDIVIACFGNVDE